MAPKTNERFAKLLDHPSLAIISMVNMEDNMWLNLRSEVEYMADSSSEVEYMADSSSEVEYMADSSSEVEYMADSSSEVGLLLDLID
jgi:hypothetical protein